MTEEQKRKIAAKAARLIDDPQALDQLRERLGLTPEQWTDIAVYIPDYLDS